jgi:uncharacterized membrane protein
MKTKRMEMLKKILLYLSSSRMPEEEKTMWISLLPIMEDEHLEKLAQVLEDEVNEVIGVYLKSVK